ncbi:MAG: VOC family protein [Gemmatimonadales bacterium]
MPSRDAAWPNGTPCWIDYGAVDVDASRAFYAEVLGWTYSGGEPGWGGYLTCLAAGSAAAGLSPSLDPTQPVGWTTYFASDDVDATAILITAAGGKVMMAPDDVGTMGRMAIALDSQGNVFGLWQTGEHAGIRIYNEPGSLVWNELATDDPPAAREFYRSVFGFRFDEIDGEGGYTTFATDGDLPLGGLGARQPDVPRGWETCFSVASTDTAVAVVKRERGKVIMAPQDTPYGRFAVVEDPWGAFFAVMQAPPDA